MGALVALSRAVVDTENLSVLKKGAHAVDSSFLSVKSGMAWPFVSVDSSLERC